MELWDALGRAGVTVAERMRAAARALPRRTARWVLRWAERGLQSTESAGEGAPPEGARAGVGPDPDRNRNDDLVRTWLRAWLQGPERPSVPFEAALAEAGREQVDPNLAAWSRTRRRPRASNRRAAARRPASGPAQLPLTWGTLTPERPARTDFSA